ncbi:MAG: RNA methyltransferase [Bacillota bacterium]|nr:RNA methyltransferase [Bacillota bacterium]
MTDINDSCLDLYYRKKENQLFKHTEYENGVFMAESSLVIHRALDAGYQPLSFLIVENEYSNYQDVFDRCDSDITIYKVSEEIFQQLKGFILLKGILGCFLRNQKENLSQLLNQSKRIVVLENLQNPTNVGAIFRNAAALFCDAVLLTDDCADPLYKRSIRVSMGNVFNIPWTYVNKKEYIQLLKENGYKIVSFALRDDSVDIEDEALNQEEKLAIIMGSEGYGLEKETIDQSDYVVKIAMNPEVDSLNVASASGIALWQLCKKNRK